MASGVVSFVVILIFISDVVQKLCRFGQVIFSPFSFCFIQMEVSSRYCFWFYNIGKYGAVQLLLTYETSSLYNRKIVEDVDRK